jgi:hypothetical protein
MYLQWAQIYIGDPNPDQDESGFFSQIRILQRAIAVPGRIFQPHYQIGIRVIANPPDLNAMVLHL